MVQSLRARFRFLSPGGSTSYETLVTGYYEPVFSARAKRDATYRFPLYTLPPGFRSWEKPHPTREQIEGRDGQGTARFRGSEIYYLKDRFEVLLAQIQGSTRLTLADGRDVHLKVAGGTDYPYVSIGAELIRDGVFEKQSVSIPVLRKYFSDNPLKLEEYAKRNNRVIFFRESKTVGAIGNLGFPVSPERTVAADQTLFPPGVIVSLETKVPDRVHGKKVTFRPLRRFVLVHDSGSGVKGNHLDLFFGSGPEAGERAGRMKENGRVMVLLQEE